MSHSVPNGTEEVLHSYATDVGSRWDHFGEFISDYLPTLGPEGTTGIFPPFNATDVGSRGDLFGEFISDYLPALGPDGTTGIFPPFNATDAGSRWDYGHIPTF